MYWLIIRYTSIALVGVAVGWVINGWRLNAKIEQIQKEIAVKDAEVLRQHREREQRLQEAANALRKAKDNEIKTITNRLNATLSELRQRQDRDTVSNTAGTCSGATGAELSRQDAEFLARLAAEADQAVAERNMCIQQYKNAR